MIRLDATTRKLQVILAGAKTTLDCAVTACYSDKTATTYTGAATVATSNGTTAVDIVAAPAASTVRDVDFLSIFNADTGSVTATIRYNDNATLYTIIKAVLPVGYTLRYTHASGWTVTDTNGAALNTIAGVTGTANEVTVTSNVISLPAALTFTGKTVTGGTFASPTLSGTVAGASTFSGITTFSAIPVLSGGAVHFPAAQVASSDANDLDDYEEGTWTNALQFGGAAVGITYAGRYGSYTKVGESVRVNSYFVLSSKGSSVGVAGVGGLPFSAKNGGTYDYTSMPIYGDLVSGITGGFMGYVGPGLSVVSLRMNNTGTASDLTDTNFAVSSGIMASGIYRSA